MGCFRVGGLGFRVEFEFCVLGVYDLGCPQMGLRLGIADSLTEVWRSGWEFRIWIQAWGFGDRVLGFGFRVWDRGLGFRVGDLWFVCGGLA